MSETGAVESGTESRESEGARPEVLEFENLYDFLSVELGRPAAEIRAEAAKPGGSESLGAAAAKTFKDRNFPFELAEAVRNPADGQVLVTPGQDLRQRIGSLITWQCRAPELPAAPFLLAARPEIMRRYRDWVDGQLEPVRENALSAQNPVFARLYAAIGEEKKAAFSALFTGLLDRAMSTPGGLQTFLSAVRNPEMRDLWSRTVQTAFVAMSVADAAHELSPPDEVRRTVETVCAAALCSDIAVMLKPSLYRNDTAHHPFRSAQIAGELGFPPEVQAAVGEHHHIPGEAAPTEEKPAAARSFEARVLVVAALFVSILAEPSKKGRDIEAIKGLSFLMAEGKLDRLAVTTLTRLYLSRKFAFFVEKAAEIAETCPHEAVAEPILWNILGERNPQKFICQYENCAYSGSQITVVSSPIAVEFDGKPLAKIKKGEYHSCRRLTEELGKLYGEVSKLSTK